MTLLNHNPKQDHLAAKRGNSLTFLVTALLVISTSLAATTVALGPGIESMVASNPIQEFMDQVAQDHLSQIEVAILANPQILQSSNWQGGGSGSSVNLPNYDVMTSTAFSTFSSPPSPIIPITLNPAPTMRINSSSTNLTVNSTLNRMDLRRLTTPPYDNMLYVEVTESVGNQTLRRGKYITLNHQGCFRENDLASNPNTTHTDTNPIAYEANETPNFQIREISGPFMQVGNERICRLPDNTTNALSCPATVMGPGNRIRMIYGGQDTFSTSTSASNLFYLWYDNDPNNNGDFSDAAYRLHLHSEFSESNLTIDENSPPISGLDLNDPFYIEVFAPSASDTDRHYKAIITYWDTNDNQVKLSYARWSRTGLVRKGMFNTTTKQLELANPFDETPSNTWTSAPNSAPFSLRRMTYHAPTHSIVAASNDTGRIYIRQLEPFLFVNDGTGGDSNPTPDDYTATASTKSTDPTLMSALNPGNQLQQSAGNISFRELWMSQDGQTVVAKTRLTLAGNTRMYVVAFHPGLDISPENSSTNLSLTGNDNGNIAVIMAFDQIAPTDTNGQSVFTSDNLRLWYNSYTNKFYWLVQGNTNASSQSLYEWNPNTWGLANSVAAEWVQNGASVQNQYSRIQYIGEEANKTNGIYTGTFRTVRKVGPTVGLGTTSLWQDADPVQISYNSKNQTYYIVDDSRLHAVSLNTGYRINLNTNQAKTSNNGRKLLVNPKTGWLFYSSAETGTRQGLFAYNPSIQQNGAVINTSDFSNNQIQGNGDLVFNPYTMQVYVLQLPTVIDLAHRPKFLRYQPYCLDNSQDTNVPITSFTRRQQVNPILDNTWYQMNSNVGSGQYQWSQYSWSQAN